MDHVAARSKRDAEDAPTQTRMRAGLRVAKHPSTDQKKARGQIRRSAARGDDIAGYDYKGDRYAPDELIEEMIRDGSASPGARDMAAEDVLDQIAGANAIDRDDEASYDSDEFPKVIFRDQWDDENENDGDDGYGDDFTATKRGSVDTSTRREGAILAAMAHATYDEQQRLARDLDEIRITRRAGALEASTLAFADRIVADHLTPVPTYGRVTSASDWLVDAEVPEFSPEDVTRQAQGAAGYWYAKLSDAVRADPGEVLAQAYGQISVQAGAFGVQRDHFGEAYLGHLGTLGAIHLGADGEWAELNDQPSTGPDVNGVPSTERSPEPRDAGSPVGADTGPEPSTGGHPEGESSYSRSPSPSTAARVLADSGGLDYRSIDDVQGDKGEHDDWDGEPGTHVERSSEEAAARNLDPNKAPGAAPDKGGQNPGGPSSQQQSGYGTSGTDADAMYRNPVSGVPDTDPMWDNTWPDTGPGEVPSKRSPNVTGMVAAASVFDALPDVTEHSAGAHNDYDVGYGKGRSDQSWNTGPDNIRHYGPDDGFSEDFRSGYTDAWNNRPHRSNTQASKVALDAPPPANNDVATDASQPKPGQDDATTQNLTPGQTVKVLDAHGKSWDAQVVEVNGEEFTYQVGEARFTGPVDQILADPNAEPDNAQVPPEDHQDQPEQKNDPDKKEPSGDDGTKNEPPWGKKSERSYPSRAYERGRWDAGMGAEPMTGGMSEEERAEYLRGHAERKQEKQEKQKKSALDQFRATVAANLARS